MGKAFWKAIYINKQTLRECNFFNYDHLIKLIKIASYVDEVGLNKNLNSEN